MSVAVEAVRRPRRAALPSLRPAAVALAAFLLAGGTAQAADRWLSVDKVAGTGVYIWDSGMRYEGGHVQGKRQGRGVLTWPDGRRFEGVFTDGQYTAGRMSYPNGTVYEGDFAASVRAGRGTQTEADGTRFEGRFVQGQEAEGVSIKPDGRRVEVNREFAVNQRSGKWVAGLIGAAVLGSVPGISGADRVRMASGFLQDVATNGQARGIQQAGADIQASHAQQAALAAQRAAPQDRLAAERVAAASTATAAAARRAA